MPRPGSILIVDDEPHIRRLLRRCLEAERFEVQETANGASVLAAVHDGSVDLILLDLNLGSEDGLNIARRIRAVSEVAIIMVSSKGDLIDKVVGLEVGADDYIVKPFELREVLARVRSVLRRTSARRDALTLAPVSDTTREPASPAPSPEPATRSPAGQPATSTADLTPPQAAAYRFAGCLLDVRAREFHDARGELVELTSREFDLLLIFLQHGRQVLTRDQIMDRLKGSDWNPTDRTIDNYIVHLRRKLTSAGAERAIKTIRGVGYQLTVRATTNQQDTPSP